MINFTLTKEKMKEFAELFGMSSLEDKKKEKCSERSDSNADRVFQSRSGGTLQGVETG